MAGRVSKEAKNFEELKFLEVVCNISYRDYDKDKAYPLIFKAHGYGGSSGQAKNTDFGKLMNQREDFILVAPDGYSKSYNVNPNGPEATYGIFYYLY